MIDRERRVSDGGEVMGRGLNANPVDNVMNESNPTKRNGMDRAGSCPDYLFPFVSCLLIDLSLGPGM
jgi:hypothetical protein